MPKQFPFKGALQGVSVDNHLFPEKGPYITEVYSFDLSAGIEAIFDTRSSIDYNQIGLMQTIIVDNSESSSALSIEALESGFKFIVPAYAQAIMPFFGGRAPRIRLRWSVNSATARLQFYNVHVAPFMEIVGSAPIAFSPASLFQGGFLGVWYDMSDLSTLFQLSGGTTPVTSPGDPVGYVGDKSNSGTPIPAIQAAAGNRPLFNGSGGKFWLEFDGITQLIASAASGIPLGNPHTCFIACQRGTNVNAFNFGSSQVSGNEYALFAASSSGRVQAGTRSVAMGYAPIFTPISAVNTFDNTVPHVLQRTVDGIPGNNTSTLDALAPASVASNWPPATNLGSTLFYPGPAIATPNAAFRSYQFLWINRLLTAGEQSDLYTFFAGKI